jgi:hypothetical protein
MAQESAKLITRLIADHVEVLSRERAMKKAGVKRRGGTLPLRIVRG